MIGLFIKLTYNLFNNILRKIKYGSRYSFFFIERFSYSSVLKIYNKGVCRIGRNIEVGNFVNISVHGNGNLSIGDGTYMNDFCMISCHGNIAIGKRCLFGPSVKIFDNNHKFFKNTGVSQDLSVGNIQVGDNTWIASNVILLKGACIGNNCVISAGCIIDKFIPDNTIVKLVQNRQIEEIYC